jgi:hypothetical protein
MSSVELPAGGAAVSAVTNVARPARRRGGFFRVVGGFVLTGFFLALAVATVPIAAVYSFIWWASLN